MILLLAYRSTESSSQHVSRAASTICCDCRRTGGIDSRSLTQNVVESISSQYIEQWPQDGLSSATCLASLDRFPTGNAPGLLRYSRSRGQLAVLRMKSDVEVSCICRSAAPVTSPPCRHMRRIRWLLSALAGVVSGTGTRPIRL